MSLRTKVVAASVVAAAASVAALPTTAHASGSGKAPLAVSLSKAGSVVLRPGGAAQTLVLKVTNNTGKTERVSGELAAFGLKHPSDIAVDSLRVRLTQVHGPRLAVVPGGSDGEVLDALVPQGAKWGTPFRIPAHTSYTWKLSVGLARNWPVNLDDDLRLGVDFQDQAHHVASGRTVLAVRKTGPVNVKLSGGSTLSYGHPAYETLTVTNRTGRAVNGSYEQIGAYNAGPGNPVPAVDVWSGGHWVRLQGNKLVQRGIWRNGTTLTYKLRVRVLGHTAAGRIRLDASGGAQGSPVSWSTFKNLTLTRG